MRDLFKSLMKWPLWFLLCVLLGTGAFFALHFTGQQSWIAVAATAAGALILTVIWYAVLKKKMGASVAQLSAETGEALEGRMKQLPNPYALISEGGKIVWRNEAFDRMLADHGTDEMVLTEWLGDIFPDAERFWARWLAQDTAGKAEEGSEEEIEAAREEQPDAVRAALPDEEEEPSSRHYLTLGERVYAADVRRVEGEASFAALMLSDETEHLQTLIELQDERNVAGLCYVDNFEELLKSTETEQQSLLSAIIEQRIAKYFQKYNGITCKTERDRFFISMDAKGLRGCSSDRFSLLSDVKTIKLGNTTPVTLSIAFGCDGATYDENMDLARTAMDLALARGGDQAIVKNPDNVEYFGGKALGEAALTRVKARVKAQALRELMAGKDQIFVMGHSFADNDSFGAAVAVCRMATSLFKEAHIVLNSLSSSVRPLYDRFQTDPDYPREMFLQNAEARRRFRDNALVVVVDTNRAPMCECPELLTLTDQIVVIDHHRQGADSIKAILSYVEPYASSACEMVAEIMQYFGEELEPNDLEAESIYSGIIVDTNSFTDRTSARTFEAAAYLKRCGADLVKVKKLLRENYTEYRAKADTTCRAEIFMDGYAFSECEAQGLDSPTVVGAQAANELLNISGIKASFVFTKLNDTVYVSARSIDEVNVQLICERLGGGGHLSVAGVQMKDVSVEEAMNRVKETIRLMVKEGAI